MLLMATSHYLLARRYLFFAQSFACFETVVITLGIWEKAVGFYMSNGSTNILIVILAIIGSLTVMSFNQLHLLYSYIICTVFITVRVYYIYGDDIFTSLRFSAFFIAGYMCLYLFSRIYVQRERDSFKHRKA